MSDYNLMDGLRPFKKYISNIPISLIQEDEDMAISNWGIEDNEYQSFSTPTLISTESLRDEESIGGITPRLVSDNTEEHFKQPRAFKNELTVRELLQLSITYLQRLWLKESAFCDELKYVLITSQLLDETILISKYYQNKKASKLQLNKQKSLIINQYGKFWKLNTSYILDPDNDYNRLILLSFLFLKYLTKNYCKFTPEQWKIMLIIIGLSLLKAFTSKRLKLKIIQSSIIKNIKKMIQSFQKLDLLATKLINKYKELKLYPHLMPPDLSINSCRKQSLDIYEFVSGTLTILINSIVSNQSMILNYVNGVELENYCGIYNIDLSELNFILQERSQPMNLRDYVEQLTPKVKNYQYLRRFFICCLLSMNNPASETSQFFEKVNRIYQSRKRSIATDFISRWQIVIINVINLSKLLESLIVSSWDFINLQSIPNSSITTETSTISTFTSQDELLSKLKDLQLHLSTLNKNQPLNDQISEFSKIAPLFEQLQQSYSNELKNLTKKQRTCATSLLNIKKRKTFSLPAQNPKISPSQRLFSLTSPTVSPKSYKRLSTGLSVPLITVMKDEPISKQHFSCDDSYLSITPNGLASPAHILEKTNEFNEKDYINEKNLLSNNDSVIITNIEGQNDDDDDNNDNDNNDNNESIDQGEFKRKLESNFNKLLGNSSHIESKMNMLEINFNDKQDKITAIPLMNELKNVLANK